MSTPYLMICVEKPKYNETKREWDVEPRWFHFQDAWKKAGLTFAESEQPVENVWLIPVNEGLQRAIQLLVHCESTRTPYKVFFLPEAPTVGCQPRK